MICSAVITAAAGTHSVATCAATWLAMAAESTTAARRHAAVDLRTHVFASRFKLQLLLAHMALAGLHELPQPNSFDSFNDGLLSY
jgi:hypothetical protein